MKWKKIAGLLLVLLSVIAMYFWESTGRDRLLLEEVLVCTRPVEIGTVITAGDLKVIKVPPESSPAGVLSPDRAGDIIGLKAARHINENSQLCPEDFSAKGAAQLPSGKSIYVLPQSWIYSRSSSLRAGDKIKLYVMPECRYMGSFPIAFVRDGGEQEVLDSAAVNSVLERKSSTASIASVEIICSAEEYFSIFEKVQSLGSACLLLVMEGESWGV